jgi:hypothetical protein
MTHQIDNIVKHLFRKNNLDEVSENELETFVDTHPYFAAGHFLLAKKIQSTRPEQTQENIATAALYYNNALWLQWLLDQDLTKKKQEDRPFGQVYNKDTNGRESEVEAVVTKEEFDEPAASTDLNKDLINEPSLLNNNSTFSDAWENESESSSASNSLLHEDDETDTNKENDTETLDTINLNEEQTIQPAIPNEEYQIPSEEHVVNGIEGFRVNGDDAGTQANDDLVSKDSQQTEEEANLTSTGENSIEPQFHDQNISASTSQDPLEEAESKALAAGIGKTLASAALIPTKAEIEKNDFTFEPYHTIDYFASQGIKLQQSDLSKDKFGKQLKSFTEWLRSMKRLPQASTETNLDEATQRSIQQVAEHSIEGKEIVTETMAEVWIKQGNREKAIDTLHKLSLLDPSKSHYFAARIEQLKAL